MIRMQIVNRNKPKAIEITRKKHKSFGKILSYTARMAFAVNAVSHCCNQTSILVYYTALIVTNVTLVGSILEN